MCENGCSVENVRENILQRVGHSFFKGTVQGTFTKEAFPVRNWKVDYSLISSKFHGIVPLYFPVWLNLNNANRSRVKLKEKVHNSALLGIFCTNKNKNICKNILVFKSLCAIYIFL
jgi:hypothetical protein